MRSGTGRHRRPRQAPAFIVAAGVTGAGIAMPLLTAGSASAVSDEAWDRAAECESGGRWSANDGNGQYGGFQLTLDLWTSYGGLDFAIRPDLASRAQQISVAERIVADMGQGALPGCGVASGLWQEYRQEQREEIDRAEEAEEAQAEEEIGASPEESTGETGELPGDVTPEPEPVDETPEAGDQPDEERAEATDRPAERPEPEAGGGRHRGDPDPAETGAEAGTERDGEAAEATDPTAPTERDDEAARGDRDGARTGGERAADERVEQPGGARMGEYRVIPGDTLSEIALHYDISGGWPALYRANETVIGDDPDFILPGQRLDLTASGR
ncbi:transglycosylase family protein [Streptomyces sp. DSM 44915]|uniref:Transglycosylase family protein n=1 Tax=Streptomyces chisholmiae TaxID=3075540 RepID=A0ABU2JZT8_9ACTN|nr:transglycosylase family protein [Streptomyces sp. DSM 44915]MDT0270455.1 transglycosylase family protein [Streptomyces sp. DSM 44915]